VPTNENDILVADSLGTQLTVLSGHEGPIVGIAMSSAFHNFVSVGDKCLFWTVDLPTFNSLMGLEEAGRRV
jgi:hypothetical protein